MLVNLQLEGRYFSLAVMLMIEPFRSMRRKPKIKTEKAGTFMLSQNYHELFLTVVAILTHIAASIDI